MPKKSKKPKNAFFYFMINFREEERKCGRNYESMQDLQKAADPAWKECNPSVRAHFEKIAMQEKIKHNVTQEKFTTYGVPLSLLDDQERLVKDAADRELKDVQNFVRLNTINKKILDEDIYIIDVNALCETNVGYVYGEVTVLRFNIRKGIKDHLHEIINPPTIPIGYASDVKVGCEQLGLDFPDPDAPKTDYMQLLANIVAYLKESDPTSKVIPPLYTMPEKEDQVWKFIMQLCTVALEDETMFRVYKLDLLFFYVINTLKDRSDEGLPKESLAQAALKKDAFKYTPRIGCDHHENGEKPTECCKSRVKRWVFTFLDSCCVVAGVAPVPGRHLPEDLDVEGALSYKERKNAERGVPLAKAPSTASYDTSLDEMYETPLYVAPSSFPKPPPRSLKPLRKPTVDTLRFQSSIVVAPELSESDFPPLCLGAGRGSGRITTDMQNLNLKK